MSVIDAGTFKEYGDQQTSVVIRHYTDGIKGGKLLNVDEFTDDVIKAGHPIIANSEGVYKPFPVTEGAFGTLPSGFSYVGINVTNADTSYPLVGIMTDGEVNDNAMPYDFSALKEAFKAAVPTIRFDHD